jgi:60S ribosomal subunit assembly/export protein LOC1
MAVKPSVKGKRPSAKASKSGSSSATPRRSKPSSTSNKITRRPPAKQQKTKPGTHNPTTSTSYKRKKRRTYTDAELNLPTLNAITPATAAAAPRGTGKKKNKVYIDDRESMMTIMALVNAEKEGQIESKMVKMRRMEEIREARRVEAEKKEQERRGRLEGVKRGLERKGQAEGGAVDTDGESQAARRIGPKKTGKKRVSFA